MKNADQRMMEFIKGQLIRENFNVFTAQTDDQQANLIIRNILDDNSCQYIEISILSRSVEYDIEIIQPINTVNNNFYYYILHSPGMGKVWLLRADELIELRKQGLDDRDSSPYLVNNFNRLKSPQFNLNEYLNK